MQILFVIIVILFVTSVLLLSIANEVEVIQQQSAQYAPGKKPAYTDEIEGLELKQGAVNL